MKNQTMKGMITLAFTLLFALTITACSSSKPTQPENVNEKLWKDSVKIVQGIEERMKKGDYPNQEDETEFDAYYSANEDLIYNKEGSGTKEERGIAIYVVDCFLLNQEYANYAKKNNFDMKMQRMKMYQERIVEMRQRLGYKE